MKKTLKEFKAGDMVWAWDTQKGKGFDCVILSVGEITRGWLTVVPLTFMESAVSRIRHGFNRRAGEVFIPKHLTGKKITWDKDGFKPITALK